MSNGSPGTGAGVRAKPFASIEVAGNSIQDGSTSRRHDEIGKLIGTALSPSTATVSERDRRRRRSRGCRCAASPARQFAARGFRCRGSRCRSSSRTRSSHRSARTPRARGRSGRREAAVHLHRPAAAPDIDVGRETKAALEFGGVRRAGYRLRSLAPPRRPDAGRQSTAAPDQGHTVRGALFLALPSVTAYHRALRE